MSRKLRYVVIGLTIFFFILFCNFITYRRAVGSVEKMQVDYENRVSEQVEVQVTKTMEKQAKKQEETEEKETQEVSTSKNTTLQVDTVYQVQNYDAVTDTTATDYDTLPEDFVGFSRRDMEDYCKEYMNDIPAEEYLKGLQSMGVVSFSGERLIIKKVYDSSKVKYKYYLIAVEGEVVIYYGDKKTIYEYTGIETKKLSKEERNKLKHGIEIKDDKELYSVLETYSS